MKFIAMFDGFNGKKGIPLPYSTVWPLLRFDVVLCITGVTDVGASWRAS